MIDITRNMFAANETVGYGSYYSELSLVLEGDSRDFRVGTRYYRFDASGQGVSFLHVSVYKNDVKGWQGDPEIFSSTKSIIADESAYTYAGVFEGETEVYPKETPITYSATTSMTSALVASISAYSISKPAFNAILQLTTTQVGNGWTTTSTTLAGASFIQSSESRIIRPIDYRITSYAEESETLDFRSLKVIGSYVTAFADEGEIGIFFSSSNMPFTAGQTFSDSVSYSYLNAISTYLISSSIPYGLDSYLSGEVASFPKPGWEAGEPSTFEATTLWNLKTSIIDIGSDHGFTTTATYISTSSSTVSLLIATGPPFPVVRRTAIRSAYGTTRTGQTVQFLVTQSVETTFPVHGGCYLVAAVKSGWVIPNNGFHTAEPNINLNTGALRNGAALSIGSARPGVSLYVPLAEDTPNFSTVAATSTYIGGPGLQDTPRTPTWLGGLGLLTTSKETFKVISDAADTYAFTSEQAGISSVFPDVVAVKKAGGGSNIIMLTPNGNASDYGQAQHNLPFHGGGYKELSLTWTFVALEAGLLIVYLDDRSETSFFTSPTMSTFNGSEKSLFSWLPASNGVVGIKKYHNEEF